MEEKLDKILTTAIDGEKYFSILDLKMNPKYNYLLNSLEAKKYKAYKESADNVYRKELKLKPFNSNFLFYYECLELMSSIEDYKSYLEIDTQSLKNINYDELVLSLVASELEGTLKIEGVNTTRQQVELILDNSYNPKNVNEQIIKNMYDGVKYIMARPKFNKDSILHLYNILSYNSLSDDLKLKDGAYYRDDMVYIASHEGCPVELIESCMDSLIEFVNDNLNKCYMLLPFIVHYYLIYIHPYFDYNGRMGRMLSLWVSILMDKEYKFPLFISEAINSNKNDYYKAIEESRINHNDLTYFLIYLTKLSNKYLLIYKNLEIIKAKLNEDGIYISLRELNYLKTIIINSNKGWFNYKAFISFIGVDITKQAALKILNNLLDLKLLISKINNRREKIYKLNLNKLTYVLNY